MLKTPNSRSSHACWSYLSGHRHVILLSLIILIGSYLRLKGLGSQGYHSDESSSMGAILGILDGGIPRYPSGVWYTRGPFYHYLTSLFVKLGGVDRFTARLPSVIFGILTIPLLYQFGKEILKNKNASLLAAILLALSPWEIFLSRSIRFYQQFQFFGLLTVFFFIKGFIFKNDRKYQNYTLIAFTGTFLSQEVAVTLLPALLLGYRFLSPNIDRRSRHHLIIGLFVVSSIIIADALLFKWMCLTPYVGISATNAPVMKLHFTQIFSLLTTFLVGYNRHHTVLSFFFLVGIPIWMIKKERIILFLYSLVFLTMGVVTVTVMQIGIRYTAEIYPIFLLLTSLTVFEIKERISAFHRKGPSAAFAARIVPALQGTALVLITLTLISSFQVFRIFDSYESMINRGDTLAHEFVRDHMMEDDIVIAGHHPGAVSNIIGKCDYYILQKGLFDEVMKKDGVMIDRRGGAKVIDSTDKLRSVFDRNERVWVIISDLRLAMYHKDLVDYLRKSTKVVFQPYLCNVFLWEGKNGIYSTAKHKGFEHFYFD